MSYSQTIAYYTFEEGSAGTKVNPTGSGSGTGSSTVTDNGDGTNGLLAWSSTASPTYSSTVPTATVLQTGASNTLSMSFDGGDDLYTANTSTGTWAANAFTSFTIEAYINSSNLSGHRTFIGRDDNGKPGQGVGAASLFYFKTYNTNLGVEFADSSNTWVSTFGTTTLSTNTWYHVAVVGDASTNTVSLYLDGNLEASVSFSGGMFNPATNTVWTLGRGQYNNAVADYFTGSLDEVRISDVALSTSEFLNASAIPEPSTYAAIVGALALAGVVWQRRRRSVVAKS